MAFNYGRGVSSCPSVCLFCKKRARHPLCGWGYLFLFYFFASRNFWLLHLRSHFYADVNALFKRNWQKGNWYKLLGKVFFLAWEITKTSCFRKNWVKSKRGFFRKNETWTMRHMDRRMDIFKTQIAKFIILISFLNHS